jgi:hypothetical protein
LGHFKVHFGLPFTTTLSPVGAGSFDLPGEPAGTLARTANSAAVALPIAGNTCRQEQTTNPHSRSTSRKTTTSSATYHSTMPRHASGGIDSQSQLHGSRLANDWQKRSAWHRWQFRSTHAPKTPRSQ